MKRVCLLTGAGGILGSAFCRRFADRYHIVGVYQRRHPPVASQLQRFVDPLAAAAPLPENQHPIFAVQADLLVGDVVGFQRAVAPIARNVDQAWAFRAPKGYEWHRVRARGGRTLLWGGWMERPPKDYFDARRKAGAAWPQHQARRLPP